MNNAKAITKYVRISPGKRACSRIDPRTYQLLQAIAAANSLQPKRWALLKKTLDSAVANAETQLDAAPRKIESYRSPRR